MDYRSLGMLLIVTFISQFRWIPYVSITIRIIFKFSSKISSFWTTLLSNTHHIPSWILLCYWNPKFCLTSKNGSKSSSAHSWLPQVSSSVSDSFHFFTVLLFMGFWRTVFVIRSRLWITWRCCFTRMNLMFVKEVLLSQRLPTSFQMIDFWVKSKELMHKFSNTILNVVIITFWSSTSIRKM